jgi:hypothetical protein
MLNENHFTKDAYEDNGRFQIHPLSSEGLEAYLSKDSYNYHFLKSKYDPALLKQVEQEYLEEREKKKMQLKNQNAINDHKNNEVPKKEDTKEQKNPPLNPNNINKNNNGKKNMGVKESTGVNKGNKKGTNTINKKNLNYHNNNNMNKGESNKNSFNPVICNIGDGRGKLKDFQQPFHS